MLNAMEKLGFSPRVYHRLLKIGQTLSDLAELDEISEKQIAEALSFRALDKI